MMTLKNTIRIVKEGLVVGVLIGLIFNIVVIQTSLQDIIKSINKNSEKQDSINIKLLDSVDKQIFENLYLRALAMEIQSEVILAKLDSNEVKLDIIENNVKLLESLLSIIKLINDHNTFIDVGYKSEVKKIIKQDKYEFLVMLKKLQQVNVFIYGAGSTQKHFNKKEQRWSGSGVTIKYKNQYYILSVAHLLSTDDAKLFMYENDNCISELEVVKVDASVDLLLLKPVQQDIEPYFYTELADCEPTTGQEVIAVGNPARLEDVVSMGRIIRYDTKYMIMSDTTYFGSSGGGIYNQEGKLIGIVSAIGNMGAPYPNQPYYIDFEIRLDIIKAFLADIE